MELDQIIEAIQAGVSDEELQSLVDQYKQEHPEETTITVLQAVRPELSGNQLNRLQQAYAEPTDLEDILEFLPTLPAVGGLAALGTKAPGVLSKVVQWLGAHPRAAKTVVGTAALGGTVALVGGVEGTLEPGEEPQRRIRTPPPELEAIHKAQAFVGATVGDLRGPDTPAGRNQNPYNIMVVDRDGSLTGTPGTVAVFAPEDVEPALRGRGFSDISQITGAPSVTPGSDISQIIAQTIEQGFGAAGIGNVDPIATISPQTVGMVRTGVPFTTLGDVVAPRDRPLVQQPATGREAFERAIEQPETFEADPLTVPAGAEIAPRTFQTYSGRTLLEWASVIAQRNGVPLNLLYGIIDHESNWNPHATNVSSREQSYGLAQINISPEAHPNIRKEQALNPIFALEWTAQKLKARFQQYGSWEAAVAAHNSPVAADYLARTGAFQNEKSASYVSDILDRANKSGLANNIFQLDPDTPIAGTGPSYTPFQAPDPATAKEFVVQEYEQLLGRKPTEDEITAGIQRIESLSQQAYQANLTQAKGGTSQAVDVEARFREGIRETGEFGFTEATHELDSFTDYASGVARLLQGGL